MDNYYRSNVPYKLKEVGFRSRVERLALCGVRGGEMAEDMSQDTG